MNGMKALPKYFLQNGMRSTTSGNVPFIINDPGAVWYIQSGSIDIFRVNYIDGTQEGARHYFCSFKEGDVFFGINSDESGFGLNFLAVGSVDTKLIRLNIKQLENVRTDKIYLEEFINIIEIWIEGLSLGLTAPVYPKPRADQLIDETGLVSFEKSTRIKSARETFWLTGTEGNALFIGIEEISFKSGSLPLPISRQVWLDLFGKSALIFERTEQIISSGKIWEALSHFYEVILTCELMNRSFINADELVRLNQKKEHQALKENVALKELSSVIDRRADNIKGKFGEEIDPLFAACELIAHELDFPIAKPTDDQKKTGIDNPVMLIADISKIRIRSVILKNNWWKSDSGPILTQLKYDSSPLALIRKGNKYTAHNTSTNTSFVVTENNYQDISGDGFVLYKTFDENKKIFFHDLFKFGLKDVRIDFVKVIMFAVVASVLGLFTPIFTSFIYDFIIPGNDKSGLLSLVLILISASIVTAIFEVSQSIISLRILSKSDYHLEAAVWDRVLSLPIKFFKKFSAGDLQSRIVGVGNIRQNVLNLILGSAFSVVFSAFSFFLLFYYSTQLAIWSLIPFAIGLVATISNGLVQMRFQKEIQKYYLKIQGLLLQLITGISKIKNSATETGAFALWASHFAKLRKSEFRSRLFQSYFEIFNSGYPIISSIIFFIIVISSVKSKGLTTGEFIAFNTAFTAFLAGMIGISNSLLNVIQLKPVYENAKPILETFPESSQSKVQIKELEGTIELSNIKFRYDKDLPYVLDNVSININAGGFIAIVGPSGSGKSTLLRILLGFEDCENGSVFYDGNDLSKVDIKSIRNQIGVVLQNGKLISGTIYKNIVGAANYNINDAWEAARLAGFDSDIEEMPMGMYTVVSEGGSTLSGGQRQRLMIARALIRKPKIIFMDEATSALDNRTQEIVSKSLEKLQATRIVIAHRLSTIINADRIVVLNNGVIEQVGKFDELISTPGLFKDLATRQIV